MNQVYTKKGKGGFEVVKQRDIFFQALTSSESELDEDKVSKPAEPEKVQERGKLPKKSTESDSTSGEESCNDYEIIDNAYSLSNLLIEDKGSEQKLEESQSASSPETSGNPSKVPKRGKSHKRSTQASAKENVDYDAEDESDEPERIAESLKTQQSTSEELEASGESTSEPSEESNWPGFSAMKAMINVVKNAFFECNDEE